MYQTVLKYNTNHEPAGTFKGGEFAKAKAKQIDELTAIHGDRFDAPTIRYVAQLERLRKHGVIVSDDLQSTEAYIKQIDNHGGNVKGMEYIASDNEWHKILDAVESETNRMAKEHNFSLTESHSPITLRRCRPTKGTGGMYDLNDSTILLSGRNIMRSARYAHDAVINGGAIGHWSISTKYALSHGEESGLHATWRHEVGHHVSLTNGALHKHLMAKLILPKSYTTRWFAENVSHYGATSLEEMNAEVFSHVTAHDYVKGSLPDVFEKAVSHMLDKGTKRAMAIKAAFADVECPSPKARLVIPEEWAFKPFIIETEPDIELITGAARTVQKFNQNHDKLGMFAKGTTAGALNKRLVDYKPDRSLSNPAETRQITDIIHDSSFVSYGDMPFLKQMHEMMGVSDPFKIPVYAYMTARKKLFNSIDATKMPLKNLVVTQKVVNKDRITQGLSEPAKQTDAPIYAVQYHGKEYIINGHHRVVTYVAEGKKHIMARVLNFDSKHPTKKFELAFKFNEHHDKLGRFTTGGGVGGGRPTQYFASLDANSLPQTIRHSYDTEAGVYAHAPAALKYFQKWLDLGAGVASSLGYKTMEKNPDTMTADEWSVKGGMLFIAPLKGRERAAEKVATDYDGHWSGLLDVVRATIAVDSLPEVLKTVRLLEASGMTLARRPNDRFANPTAEHYRDLMLNVHLPNGLIGELQINLKPMLLAKIKGHEHYKVIRKVLAANAKKPVSEWSEENKVAFDKATHASQKIYDKAWQQLNRG